jgi:hypothetical protein
MSNGATISPPPIKVYLRDRFQLESGGEAAFEAGVKEQLRFAQGTWRLVAACAERPFDLIEAQRMPGGAASTELPPPMMHIWEQPKGDWAALYNAMYASSELPWYSTLESSIATESQELLVDFRLGYGITRRPKWSKGQPDVYLYEERRLNKGADQLKFIISTIAFSEAARENGWKWIWNASQVTGEPALVCSLWRASHEEHIWKVLAELSRKDYYQQLEKLSQPLTRRIMYPIATELWDDTK